MHRRGGRTHVRWCRGRRVAERERARAAVVSVGRRAPTVRRRPRRTRAAQQGGCWRCALCERRISVCSLLLLWFCCGCCHQPTAATTRHLPFRLFVRALGKVSLRSIPDNARRRLVNGSPGRAAGRESPVSLSSTTKKEGGGDPQKIATNKKIRINPPYARN